MEALVRLVAGPVLAGLLVAGFSSCPNPATITPSDTGDDGTTTPTTYTVTGTVSGLSGQATLRLNGATVQQVSAKVGHRLQLDTTSGGDSIVVSENGAFSYQVTMEDPAAFSVSLVSIPGVQTGWVANPGSLSGTIYSGIAVEFANLCFFGAFDGSSMGLWKSDGTPEGTVKVRDFADIAANPNAYFTDRGIEPYVPVILNGAVYFNASADGMYSELWKSDGTAAGTSQLTTYTVSGYGADPYFLAATNSGLYFAGASAAGPDALWKSDGTPGGTAILNDASGNPVAGPIFLRSSGDTLYLATDYYNQGDYDAVWTSISGGAPEMLVDFGTITGGWSPWYLTVLGGHVCFSASDSGENLRLWAFDPSVTPAAGSNPLMLDTASIPDNLDAWDLTTVGNKIFFFADVYLSGYELWTSDGTPLGTQSVAVVDSGYHLAPGFPAIVGTDLYFVADDGSGADIWKSNGTGASPLSVASSGGLADLGHLSPVGNILVFAGDDIEHGAEPWAFDTARAVDGTNPYLLKDIVPGQLGSVGGGGAAQD